MKIDFCSDWHPAKSKPDEHGLCVHGKPMRGAPMKCIHCTRAETIPYGDACSQCGNPAVGELGEPVIVLGEDVPDDEVDCGCRLVREVGDIVSLFMCKLHHGAQELNDSFDEVCSQMGCSVDDIPDKFMQVCMERDKALGALGVDEELEGDKLTAAIEKADEEIGNGAMSYRPTAEKLLELVGITEAVWFYGGLETYYEGRFNSVDFLVSRLRALAPDKLSKELRPKATRQRRAKKSKAPDAKAPEAEEEPRLRLVKR